MANRLILSVFFVVFLLLHCVGQPQPCDPQNPEMTSFCADACIICDIDGFTGRHEGTEDGEAPPGFEGECTRVQHNMQWIAFIAGSVDLRVGLSVSNCLLNNGLEFGLYKGIDCANFERISNCFGGFSSIPPNRTGTIENIEPLVIGQYYYIVMDGALEDNCDWTFTVEEGSTSSLELVEPTDIIGQTTACLNQEVEYLTVPELGSTLFNWVLNGEEVGNVNDSIVNLTFDEPGSYTLCVTQANACKSAPESCIQIRVDPDPTEEIVATFCENDCFLVAGEEVCEGGMYTYVIPSVSGCDSIIIADLTQLTTPITNLDLDLCDEDTLFVGGAPFVESGIFQQTIESSVGCDSIVNLDLFVIVCNIQGEELVSNVACHAGSNGEISFSVADGTAPFTYEWAKIDDSSIAGSGTLSAVGETDNLPNLTFGTYGITIEDNFGNFEILIAEVLQPEPLAVIIDDVDKNGFSVSCAGLADGELEAFVEGGVSGYSYMWNTNDTGLTLEDIPAGTYSVVITDSNGCTQEANFEATGPLPLQLSADFINPNCDGLESGAITVTNTEGGAGAYEYSIDGITYQLGSSFDGLGPGDNTIIVRDDNGCLDSLSEILVAPQIPIVDLGPDITIALGDSILLSGETNGVDITNLSWSTTDPLSCPTCLETYITALSTQQVSLQVTSVDDCTKVNSLLLTVEKFRNFYAPTLMQHTAPGDNSSFVLFSGPEISSYNLYIYDRWGNLVFEGLDLQGQDVSEGWDGRYKNTTVNPGVFVWQAEVNFIDGFSDSYTGSITVIN